MSHIIYKLLWELGHLAKLVAYAQFMGHASDYDFDDTSHVTMPYAWCPCLIIPLLRLLPDAGTEDVERWRQEAVARDLSAGTDTRCSLWYEFGNSSVVNCCLEEGHFSTVIFVAGPLCPQRVGGK